MRKLRRIAFTKEGYDKLKNEYETLAGKRSVAVATLKQARELGDLSENGLYKAARANLSSIDYNLRRLDTLVKLAFVTDTKTNDTVSLGTVVLVKNNGITKQLTLVGEYEANPAENKVSINSPIGKALFGKKAGDRITVNTPQGSVYYEIIELSPSGLNTR